MMALNKLNIEMEWFDARKVNDLNIDNLVGNDKEFVGFIFSTTRNL